MSYSDRLTEALEQVQASVSQAPHGGQLRHELVFAMAALMVCLGQVSSGGGDGGGGSGASQAEIQEAIEAAINLASVSSHLEGIATLLENGTLTEAQTTAAMKAAIQTATNLDWFTPTIFADIMANLLTEQSQYSHGLNLNQYTANFTVDLTGIRIGFLRIQYVSDDDPTNELLIEIGGSPLAILNPGGVVEIPKTFSDSGDLVGTLSNTAGNHKILVNILMAM